MDNFFIRSILLLHIVPYFGQTTRFLPMLVWDHLNPQLTCKCNWNVIPHADLYDRLEFVCPTLKIAINQLDGYSRPETEMNENIFRRKWLGNKEALRKSIESGTIHSFCDPTSSHSTKIHTCNNGDYSSTAVTLKHSTDSRTNYERNQIYIFFNNGDDGRRSSLGNTRSHCSMLFAVYVSNRERLEHDFTFGKTALSSKCQCKQPTSNCPTPSAASAPTSTSIASSTISELSSLIQPTSTSSSEQLKTTMTITTQSKSTWSPDNTLVTEQRLKTTINNQPTSTSNDPTKAEESSFATECPVEKPTECEHSWLSTWLLIVIITSVLVLPSITCFIIYTVAKGKSNTQEGFNNNTVYYPETQDQERYGLAKV